MGYMLFNERMLESFIHARKWLRPGGTHTHLRPQTIYHLLITVIIQSYVLSNSLIFHISKKAKPSSPFKCSPGSHSQLVSCSVGIKSYLPASGISALSQHHVYVASAPRYVELVTVLDYSR